MRKLFLLILLLLLEVMLFTGCGSKPEPAADGLQIVTTVFPAYDFARQIAGDRAQVTLLLPPGAEVHSFEPTAKDMVRIHSADLFFCNGGESEAWAEQLLQSGEEIRSLAMLDCVEALEEERDALKNEIDMLKAAAKDYKARFLALIEDQQHVLKAENVLFE